MGGFDSVEIALGMYDRVRMGRDGDGLEENRYMREGGEIMSGISPILTG